MKTKTPLVSPLSAALTKQKAKGKLRKKAKAATASSNLPPWLK